MTLQEQALFNLHRVYRYHEKFFDKNIKPEEFKKRQEEIEKDLKVILDEEESERRDQLKAQGLWEDIYYILKIEVVRAIGIKKADTFGKSDAYCTVAVNSDSVDRTDTIMKSLDPEWNHIFKIRITEEKYDEEEFSLRFELFDYDAIGKDDFLGMHELKRKDFMEHFVLLDRNTVEEYDLCNRDGNKGTGKLSIKFISLKKFGDDTRIPNPPEDTEEDDEVDQDDGSNDVSVYASSHESSISPPSSPRPELDYEENASYEDSQELNISLPPSVDRDEDQNIEEIGGEVELGENTDAQSSFGRKYQKKTY